MDRIGLPGTNLSVTDRGATTGPREIEVVDHGKAIDVLLDWLEAQPAFGALSGVGHRVVHGMAHTQPQRVTVELLAELRRITPYDPEHLPREIELIEALKRRYPRLEQAACFDTAFHRSMPRVATVLPIPRRYQALGVQRYGFHGLSYAYLLEELARLADPAALSGRVILAHLGNGASMAAVQNGKCVDTSMAFTPAAGLVMSTRTGDIDPGLPYYLARSEAMSAEKFQHMVNHQSGLLGVSESSSDVRDLLASEALDARAAEALALFCYQAKKWIGSFCAALGGLDALVFAGGIGENAPAIRSRICAGLQFAGVELDEARNAENAPLISRQGAPVRVRVVHTDEELMVAKLTVQVLDMAETKES
jgi:acetate kinase